MPLGGWWHRLAAASLALSAEDIAAIDRLHPPPRRKTPLAMI